MDLITNIINLIETNLPSVIATTGSILTILTGIVLIIRKGKELFGIGSNLVKNVVSSFTDITERLFGNVNKLMTDMRRDFTEQMLTMRKELNEQLQIAQNEIKTSMEITSMVVLSKSVSPAVKQEIMNKASQFSNDNLKKYVVDLVKTEKPITDTVQLAEVKEVIPDTIDLHKNVNNVKPYIPSSE